MSSVKKGKRSTAGFTLVETLIAVVLFGVATAGIMTCFMAGLRMYSTSVDRRTIQREASRALTTLDDAVRSASSINISPDGNKLDLVTSLYGQSDGRYRYMLYHPADPPPNQSFTEDSYTLVRVPVTPTPLNYDYSAAMVIARDITPPQQGEAIFAAGIPAGTPTPQAGGGLVSVQLDFKKDRETLTAGSRVAARN